MKIGQAKRLVLGTVQFGLDYGISNTAGKVVFDEVKRILSWSRSSGLNTLDTAIAYGDSERILGRIGVQDWNIISKLPVIPAGCTDVAAWVVSQVESSLDRLGIQQLHQLLLHRPDQLLGEYGKELSEILVSVREWGLTEKIGVSVYSPAEITPLCTIMRFDSIQAPLNIFDRRILKSGWAQKLREQGTELHARSIFLQGLLLLPAESRPQKFKRWQSLWSEWDQWLLESGLSRLEACIGFVFSVSAVDKILVGVVNVSQLHQIIAAADVGSAFTVPNWINPIDIDLVNPSRWKFL